MEIYPRIVLRSLTKRKNVYSKFQGQVKDGDLSLITLPKLRKSARAKGGWPSKNSGKPSGGGRDNNPPK